MKRIINEKKSNNTIISGSLPEVGCFGQFCNRPVLKDQNSYILDSEAEGNKTKEMNYLSVNLKGFFFVLYPTA